MMNKVPISPDEFMSCRKFEFSGASNALSRKLLQGKMGNDGVEAVASF